MKEFNHIVTAKSSTRFLMSQKLIIPALRFMTYITVALEKQR